MIKKIGAAILAIILIAGMASCTSNKPSTPSTPNTPNTASTPSTSNTSQDENESDSTPTASGAYEAVFDDTYIVHLQSFFNMEMSCFAMKTEDGRICCADYGYKDDVVRQWVETVYIPISECTDSEKAELVSNVKTQSADFEALSCCYVKYDMGMNYYTVTFTFTDVDKAENYSELYNAGFLAEKTFISMSQTEGNLLNQGYVKK